MTEQPTKKRPDLSKIWISVPTEGARNMHFELVARLLHWTRCGGFVSATVGVHPIDHARNESVRTFLNPPTQAFKDWDFTHLFFVDDDTVPPNEAIVKLLALDKPIATGITPIMRMQGDELTQVYNCFLETTKVQNALGETVTQLNSIDPDSTEPVQIERCGGSCLLIHRDVLEKMAAPWFKNLWNEEYTTYLGEDFYFCDKAREAGFEIWCDPTVKCKHAKLLFLE